MTAIIDELGQLEAPLLKRLLIATCSDHTRRDWVLKPFGGDACKLEVLHITHGKRNWHPSLLRNLTSLELGTLWMYGIRCKWHITVFEILTTLAQTPRLQRLRIHSEPELGLPWTSAQIMLAELNEFKLNSMRGAWRKALIHQIVAPKLRCITCDDTPTLFSPSMVMSLAQCRIFPLPELQELYLGSTGLGDTLCRDNFTFLLEQFPQLRDLTICASTLDEAAFNGLSTRFPNLHKLKIIGISHELESAILRKMALARVGDPILSQLSVLQVYSSTKGLRKEDTVWFEANVRDFTWHL